MSFIDKLTGGAKVVSETVESIGGVVDRFVDTNGEKADRNAEIEKALQEHTEKVLALQYADTANARDMNAKIQGDKPSWLAKNVAYILDLTFTASFLFMLMLILKREVPESNRELFYTGFGVLGALCSTVLNFHRGTSRGSEVKTDAMVKQMR